VDLVATFPFARIVEAVQARKRKNAEALSVMRALKMAKITRMLKVLRVFKLSSFMRVFEEQLVVAQSRTVMYQLIKIAASMLLILHVGACAWYAFGYWSLRLSFEHSWVSDMDLLESPPLTGYTAAMYFAITTGTTVGYGDIHAHNTLEYLGCCIIVVTIVSCIGHFLARLGQVISSLSAAEADKMRTKHDAMAFMQKRGVGKELYHKVLRYIEHTSDIESISSLDHTGFLEKLSESLQSELRIAVLGSFLQEFPLFEHADELVLKAMCLVCRTVRAGRGDQVVEEGQPNLDMYMILRGEVLILRHDRIIGCLAYQDWFGEKSMFFARLVHNVSLKCETECEFLVLAQSSFKEQISLFPTLRDQYMEVVEKLGVPVSQLLLTPEKLTPGTP
jgi:hypothetical protein